jgi:Domain of unknown function (DUF4332)
MMLRTLFKFLTAQPNPPRRIESTDGRSVVLYAHVDVTAKAKQLQATRLRESFPRDALPPSKGDHRAWLLSMRLDHLRIFTPVRCERLTEIGIVTAGDLVTADLARLGRTLGDQTLPRRLKRTVRAILLAAAVPGMMPRDAMLLMCVHRPSVRSLASESPAILHRDLQRFALSTKGQRATKGRRLPSVKRIRRWVETRSQSTNSQPSSTGGPVATWTNVSLNGRTCP